MRHLDKLTSLELSGVVFELRELGDLSAEIAIFSDGHYDVLGEKKNLTYLYSEAYLYCCTGISNYGCPEAEEYYFDKLVMFRPILDRIASKISEVTLPEDKELKIIPILNLLG